MCLKQHKIEILSILSENLQNPTPELVPTTLIEGQMEISAVALRKALKTMQGMGVIESDPELRYSLITREGVTWLNMQKQGY